MRGQKLVIAAVAVIVFTAFTDTSALADSLSIAFQESGVNGGARTIVAGPTAGSLSFSNFSYGNYQLNSVSADGPTVLSSPHVLDSNSLNIANPNPTNVALEVWVTDTGITSPTGASILESSFTSNTLTTGWSVTEHSFYDATNTAFGTTTPLGSDTFTAAGSSALFSPQTLHAPYSLTEEYVINPGGIVSGSANSTINLSAVPEPASLVLLGSGLAGLAGWRSWRRRGSH